MPGVLHCGYTVVLGASMCRSTCTPSMCAPRKAFRNVKWMSTGMSLINVDPCAGSSDYKKSRHTYDKLYECDMAVLGTLAIWTHYGAVQCITIESHVEPHGSSVNTFQLLQLL